MKTLVIHPTDPTTRFLSVIYEGKKGWKIVKRKTAKRTLMKHILDHDRIIMLGHGVPFGLLGQEGLVIDSSFAYLLKEKILVCVWCNADIFMNSFGLKGFHTGMIISENKEAVMYDIDTDPMVLKQSNKLFAEAIREGIDENNMLEMVLSKYVGDDAIINFNRDRIYCNGYISNG